MGHSDGTEAAGSFVDSASDLSWKHGEEMSSFNVVLEFVQARDRSVNAVSPGKKEQGLDLTCYFWFFGRSVVVGFIAKATVEVNDGSSQCVVDREIARQTWEEFS